MATPGVYKEYWTDDDKEKQEEKRKVSNYSKFIVCVSPQRLGHLINPGKNQ